MRDDAVLRRALPLGRGLGRDVCVWDTLAAGDCMCGTYAEKVTSKCDHVDNESNKYDSNFTT